MRSTRLLLIGAFLLLLALPGLQTGHPFVREVPLSGVLVQSPKPLLTLGAWWRGELQAQAENWFDEHIGFRGHAVRTDNQIGLSVFGEAFSRASDSVVMGRRVVVYGDVYVTAYDGISDFSDQRLRKRVRSLRRLQDGLARRGIAFVLLISPSKASIYPEYLPRGFVHPDGQRPKGTYERMLPMLRSAGIHVVDSRALLLEEKGRSAHALFPPGGIHWNRYSCALVLRRAWQALGEQLGRPLVELNWHSVREDDAPLWADQETDAADLLNVWHVEHGDWKYPRPDLFAEDSGGRFRPSLVVVGDSFWWLADKIIVANRLASKSEFFYYYNELGGRQNNPLSGQPRGLRHGMSWDYVLSAEAIIVETNEAGIGDAGWGFPEAAVTQLTAGSPEPGRVH
jgi:alginate O-acetyltransferase complex protein AlgJ